MSNFPVGQMFKYNGNYFPLAQYQKLVGNEKKVVKKEEPKKEVKELPKEEPKTPPVSSEDKEVEVQSELSDIDVARVSYEKIIGSVVPINKKNDIEWMEKKIKEKKRSMV